MSAHTPGPWEVDPLTAKVNQAATGLPLAMLQWPSNDRSEHETKANARLIAAAPELLEALDSMMRIIGPPESAQWANEDEINAAWNSAVAAIAKAKGENHE